MNINQRTWRRPFPVLLMMFIVPYILFLVQKISGAQPATFQLSSPPPTTSLFFGGLHTAATLSTWTVWPLLDALMLLMGLPSIRITCITQVVTSFSYVITLLMLTFKFPAATRIRRQRRHNPQFDHRPISRFEDAKRMRTWPCPQEGCGQVQFSVFSHGDWYSNVHGMTMDGHSISGPTHL